MANREAQIKGILSDFNHLFIENINSIPVKRMNNKFFCPYHVNIKAEDEGIILKDKVGYITIAELFEDNQVKSYTYRFISGHYKLITICTDDNKESDPDKFRFYYDKLENDKPHKPHFTVIYPDIRYMTNEIKLNEFLSFIQESFYTRKDGEFIRKKGKLWDNRM